MLSTFELTKHCLKTEKRLQHQWRNQKYDAKTKVERVDSTE